MTVKYDKIGVNYNLTRNADKFLTQQLYKLLQIQKTGVYLDIGCGTGNYTNALSLKGLNFIGIDPSKKMLSNAMLKNETIDWRVGTADNTGLTSNSINGVIAFLTIHHWSNLKNSFTELRRIMKPGSRIVIFTSTPEQMKNYWLNYYFPDMLKKSIDQMPSLQNIKNAFNYAGLQLVLTKTYSVQPDLQDHFLYCGKENPSLYFDNNIRNGISSFSSLANKKEVESGLQLLKKDINSGKFILIKNFCINDDGDYLFIVAEKPMD